MNDSFELPKLNSTISLSSRLQDTLNVFVYPAISIAIILVKLISITVLSIVIRKKKRKKEKASQFYYLLAYEAFDLIGTVILLFGVLIRCGSYCSMGYNYVSKLFDLIVCMYGIGVCIQVQTFMEITFCVERIQAFKETTSAANAHPMRFRTKLAIAVAVSLIVVAPHFLIARAIKPIAILMPANQTLYTISDSILVKNNFWRLFLFAFGLSHGFFLFILLLIINIVLVQRLKSYASRHQVKVNAIPIDTPNQTVTTRKETIKTNTKKETVSMTRLVLVMNGNFLLGNLPASLSPILFLIFGTSSPIYIWYSFLTSLLLIICHFNYTFIYYKLSRSFKKTLLNTFFK